ncbi:hypothetical protein ACWT_6285 [Actinoplanes sp. SE50]|uniref:hypothetical protein n=1 Tax=unclassified Actinoplanes TaxID=2626549 RepID=UPI00023ED300|nr:MULTISPECIES: hypothetical protein [unclassified Actinoplanes]AEV87300.1 hypothetical protein ACPL_6418 [Actinoplanes sp. SE50/110]ATO85700.1 hypothetical protein ACWT_6285 [Actinoplanes sp. SE50]SLM03113.1 uncharacterized protein ACSP50_6402 [Actinoplanes sp. SE50/110]
MTFPPSVETRFPNFADHTGKLAGLGVEFFLASNETIRPHLNEQPYGHKLSWLDFTDTGERDWSVRDFLNLFNVINGIAFGDRGIPMPQWVMVDLILMPAAALIAGLPQDEFAAMVERSTFRFDTDVKQLLRKVQEDMRAGGYTGPVPVGGYCAAPSAEPGRWVGWSLWSLMPAVGLGKAAKALALSAYRAQKLDGVTQYDNSALKVHTEFGALKVLVATVPFHTSPGSFVYQSDLTLPADAALPEPAFLLDPFDYDRQQAMQKAIEAGSSEFYVLPPGHVVQDGRTYVPIFEKELPR